MNFRSRPRRDSGNVMINITPLIDVVFILLIFFAVTTSFISSSSIKVDLPQAKGEAVEKKNNVRVAVDDKGVIYVDGLPVKDGELADKLKDLKKTAPDALVVIEGDKKAMLGKVVFVIDNAREADYTRFAIATQEAE